MTSRLDQAQAIQDQLVAHRRTLHAEPEVGLELPDTHEYVADALATLGLKPHVAPGAGVTALIEGTGRDTSQEPAVVLRSEMDALPVEEQTGLAFASRRPGAMHACGHDLHIAMLLGAAQCLVEHPPTRDVVLTFQPGEESDRGAVPTLREHPLLQREQGETFAVHVHALWPTQSVHYTPGVFMAYGDWFRADFTGPGGHASQPQLAGNPVDAAARFVTSAREIVDELYPREPLVATVTEVLMGNTVNVIPPTGRLRGTLRTLSSHQREELHLRLRQACGDAATASRTESRFVITEGYPAVVNDVAYVDRIVHTLSDSPLASGLTAMSEPSMVIEDYAYFLQRWPGAMVYLGAHLPGRTAFNHSGDADFDEAVLATGTALHLLAADGWG